MKKDVIITLDELLQLFTAVIEMLVAEEGGKSEEVVGRLKKLIWVIKGEADEKG